MLVRLLGRVGVILAPVGIVLSLAAPSQAAGELHVDGNFVCTIAPAPGQRSITFVVRSDRPETGTVMDFSISPSTVTGYLTPVGSALGGNSTASAQVGAGPGPTSVSMSITVRWPTGGADGGPLDVTATRTIPLNPCQPRPRATLTSRCDGSVEVTMYNGTVNDVTETGGHATFEIFGAYGYHAGPYSVQPWRGPGTAIVPAVAAGSITVKGEGAVVAQGGYVATPGCAGSGPEEPPPANPGGGGGPGQHALPGGTSSPDVTPTGPDGSGPTVSAPARGVTVGVKAAGDRGTTGRTTTGRTAIGLAGGAVLGLAGAGGVLFWWRRRIVRIGGTQS